MESARKDSATFEHFVKPPSTSKPRPSSTPTERTPLLARSMSTQVNAEDTHTLVDSDTAGDLQSASDEPILMREMSSPQNPSLSVPGNSSVENAPLLDDTASSPKSSVHTAEDGMGGLERKWLLLCIQKGDGYEYVNIEVTNPPASDQEFFRTLKQARNKHANLIRRFFGSVVAIKFVQFNPYYDGTVVLRERDSIPPPQEVYVGNWTYSPCPPTFPVPLASEDMLRFYNRPKRASPFLDIYERVPKKLRSPARYLSSRHLAWVILMEEHKSLKLFASCCLASVVLCVTPSIYYWKAKGDATLGISITAVLAAICALLIMAARDA